MKTSTYAKFILSLFVTVIFFSNNLMAGDSWKSRCSKDLIEKLEDAKPGEIFEVFALLRDTAEPAEDTDGRVSRNGAIQVRINGDEAKIQALLDSLNGEKEEMIISADVTPLISPVTDPEILKTLSDSLRLALEVSSLPKTFFISVEISNGAVNDEAEKIVQEHLDPILKDNGLRPSKRGRSTHNKRVSVPILETLGDGSEIKAIVSVLKDLKTVKELQKPLFSLTPHENHFNPVPKVIVTFEGEKHLLIGYQLLTDLGFSIDTIAIEKREIQATVGVETSLAVEITLEQAMLDKTLGIQDIEWQ